MSSLTPSPSPSPNPQPENNSNTTTWAFPGPSSRFHTRERIRPRREVKSTYIPVAPNLSTAQRAQHKRAQSAQVVPLAKRSRGSGGGGGGGESAGGCFPGPASPPASETAGRSPFLSRFSSWTGGESPSLRRRRTSLAMSHSGGLMTPARRSGGDWDKRLQDSPFSDYFTDDARSVDTSAGKSSMHGGSGGAWLSEEGQELLARLGRLQTRVMRADEGEQECVRRIVERKVQEVERELEDCYHRPGSAELEDSGFIDEEGEEVGGASDDGVQGLGLHGVSERPEREDIEQDDVSSQKVGSESDHQLSEARQILENVTKAQEELRKRHAELVRLNEQHLEQLEDNETEIETLRSENESLRSDLGFDHSELLFLKLQMKAIEVEVEDLDKPESQAQKLANHGQHGEKNIRRGQILQEMDQWRNDWQDVNGRLKRRLSRYGVLSADKRDHSLEKALQVRGEDLGDWQLETIRESSGGKVASLTIRRVEDRGEQVADGVVEVQAGLGKAGEGRMVSHHAEQQASSSAGAIEKGCQTEDRRHSMGYTEQGSQTDRISPPSTVDLDIQTDTQNNGNTSTSTDNINLPSPFNPALSYQNEATQTEISLANLLPPRYYAPDAYGVEESGEAVTELSFADGGKDRDPSIPVREEDNGEGEGVEEEDEEEEDEEGFEDDEDDEDDEEEMDEDEDECAITTSSPSSPPTHKDDDGGDSSSSTPPSEESPGANAPSSPQQQQQHQGQKTKYKSAWAELWEGLGHLAGVGGDEDEDEDEEEE
ncbi:hypothetical protein KC333_g5048 [Hortaea werneckii]|nr:hypothetical protein KC333_g5048 [Hortaea werneckii]KAI7321905.1 hypothetical protein KC326_g2061 [Hortaea werneckii]